MLTDVASMLHDFDAMLTYIELKCMNICSMFINIEAMLHDIDWMLTDMDAM